MTGQKLVLKQLGKIAHCVAYEITEVRNLKGPWTAGNGVCLKTTDGPTGFTGGTLCVSNTLHLRERPFLCSASEAPDLLQAVWEFCTQQLIGKVVTCQGNLICIAQVRPKTRCLLDDRNRSWSAEHGVNLACEEEVRLYDRLKGLIGQRCHVMKSNSSTSILDGEILTVSDIRCNGSVQVLDGRVFEHAVPVMPKADKSTDNPLIGRICWVNNGKGCVKQLAVIRKYVDGYVTDVGHFLYATPVSKMMLSSWLHAEIQSERPDTQEK